MALFSKKTEVKETKKEKTPKSVSVSTKKVEETSATLSVGKDYARVLRSPRVTEKATFASENGAYVFNVDPRATKIDIARAIEIFYKVKPLKVNTVQIPAKKVSLKKRGVFGKTASGKKAYVYLKEGDTIEIV